MGGWGPPLRLARRSARRSPGRTVLVAALIGLPVMVATCFGVTAAAGNPKGETLARITLGQADAELTVTPYGRVSAEEASQGWTGPLQGAETPVRDVRKFDPLPLLPPGTKLVRSFQESGTLTIRGEHANTSVPVVAGDGTTALTTDTVKLDAGRFPTGRDDVAISPALAKALGLADGDELRPGAALTGEEGKKYQVVGLARTIWSPENRRVFVSPSSSVIDPDPLATIQYLVDLPDEVDPNSLIGPLAAKGLSLQTRAHVINPPPSPYGPATQDLGPYAVMALVIGFGILEIVLLAGTAFAVGTRRQSRDLGLVLAAGGTPRDVRRIVLAQGLSTGVVGAVAGLVLAGGVLIAGKPLWETLNSQIYIAWQVPWAGLAGIALLGVLAGLAAAVVPAIGAGRQAPVAALNSRFGRTAGAVRLNKVAVALVIAGVTLVMIGNIGLGRALAEVERHARNDGYRASATPNGPIALVLLGITIVVGALVWMLPKLVAFAAKPAHRFPLSGRLALRDAARHRHRTGPATAAIMMAVAGTAAAAFAVSNGVAAEAESYTPTTRPGFGSTNFYAGKNFAYSEANEKRLAGMLPVEASYRFGEVASPGVKLRPDGYNSPISLATREYKGQLGLGLTVVDPAFVAGLGEEGAKTAEQLRAGKVVVPWPAALTRSKVSLIGEDPVVLKDGYPVSKSLGKYPGVFVGELPRMQNVSDSALISSQAAAELGTVQITRVDFELTREPTGEELAAIARMLDSEDRFIVEKGYQSPARLAMLGVLGAAAIFTLLGVAISVSLSAAEGRADLATLAAVGAQPRRRRGLAAAQAWVLGQLGCVLGVGVGALYGYTAHVAFGSPTFVVPWLEIAGIVLLVPLFAGALAGLLTRSRLPMVSRIE